MKILKHFLLTCVCLATTATFAQNSGDAGPLHWEYTPDDFTLTISGAGRMPSYMIADSVPWYHLRESVKYINFEEGAVTIGTWAFYGFSTLISISIPNTVVMIESAAFANNISLTEVSIGNSVKTIMGYSFMGCTSLTSVTIPNSVNTIGLCAFQACTALTRVNIGNAVKTIGNNAFMACTALTEVILPNALVSIGSFAFDGCTALTMVDIPAMLTEIGVSAFANCASLKEVINYAQTPQTVNANVFQGVNLSLCTLHVNYASLIAYQTANVWKDFGTVLAIAGTGVNEVLTKNISIFPNPVRNELNIESGELNIENAEIMDLSGKIVSTFNYSENKINVSTLSAGIYFIKINTDKGSITEKFVKE